METRVYLMGRLETRSGGWERTNMFGGICEGGGRKDKGETGGATLNSMEDGRSGGLTMEEGDNGAREMGGGLCWGCHCCCRWIVPISMSIPNAHPKIISISAKSPSLINPAQFPLHSRHTNSSLRCFLRSKSWTLICVDDVPS